MKTLVVGCGYVGRALAERLREGGHAVAAWTHSAESGRALVEAGFGPVMVGSVADEKVWENVEPFDWVVHCASSGSRGAEAYREVFVEGMRQICSRQPAARKLMVSSTSVYGQRQGELVTEQSAAAPTVETGKILREAEELALDHGVIVARSAGIYGPGRAVLLEKLRRGDAVIEGDGGRWINQIHRDDLAQALLHLLQCGEAGQIYNVSDGTPLTQRDYYAVASELLGLPLPPYGPVNLQRKRGLTNKRVATEKLAASGWKPRFADFRSRLAAMLVEEKSSYSPR